MRVKIIVFGAVAGIVAGAIIILLSRVLNFNFTPSQEEFSFLAFAVMGLIMGIVNAVLIKPN